jgi:hypothetical protein
MTDESTVRFWEEFREETDHAQMMTEKNTIPGQERAKSAKFYIILKKPESGFEGGPVQSALKVIDAARYEKNPLFDYLISYGGDQKNNLGINLQFSKNIPDQKKNIIKFLSDKGIATESTHPVIDGRPISETEIPLAA